MPPLLDFGRQPFHYLTELPQHPQQLAANLGGAEDGRARGQHTQFCASNMQYCV